MAQDDMIRSWSDLAALYTGRFDPGPLYSPETDVLHVFIADELDVGRSLDKWLIVSRSVQTNQVTACSLYAVRRRLLPIVRTLALDEGDNEVTVKALLLAAMIAAADDAGPAHLNRRGYLEALAPICRAVGEMRVELTPMTSD